MAMAAELLRHQANSLVATVIDFGVMIALVSLVGAAPVIGTAIGAASGATVNFVLGRSWVFRATARTAAPQAGRYAVVSLASLLLNASGVAALVDLLHVQYIAARAAVAILVSVCWNFPLQRRFVFEAGRR